MNNPTATPEYAGSETLVWWDMDSCPLPNGYDPRRVGSRIDTELMNLGYNGPLSIVAVGNLDGIPYNFLEALSSTGVVIKHTGTDISRVLLCSKSFPQPPVTIMVITADSTLLESLTRHFYICGAGYNILLAYPPTFEPKDPDPSSLIDVGGEWQWDRDGLLKDSGSAKETRRLDKGSEMFSCGSRLFYCFDDFITHLQSSEHAQEIVMEKESREMEFKRYAENIELNKQSKPYLDLVRASLLDFEMFQNFIS